MKELNNTINQQDLDLSHIDGSPNPTTAEYTFFSSAYRTYTKIYHNMDQNTNLNKFKGN